MPGCSPRRCSSPCTSLEQSWPSAMCAARSPCFRPQCESENREADMSNRLATAMQGAKRIPLALSVALMIWSGACAAQEYEFKGGFPTPETIQRAYDDADLARAIQTY